jgi:hypothetical protein
MINQAKIDDNSWTAKKIPTDQKKKKKSKKLDVCFSECNVSVIE